ncbi:carboxymuconolactone decarboxylase family protein [Desulfoferrobacter suflitae]|uniref:carboxymuconolactone decarboxylase family protein n=1 Tax=Desulfoferrobacter suflitae TaxID=2865782 RepID=UPI003EB92475
MLGKYLRFFNVVYAEGAIDRRTKHLIALGASLAAGCDPRTRYCLAVARALGATEDQLKETMAIAMTVGATKIRILQESALAPMPERKAGKPKWRCHSGLCEEILSHKFELFLADFSSGITTFQYV